jgi:hypothetical protein
LKWIEAHAEVLPFDTRCADVAGRFGGALSKSGTPIGFADVLIAATAIVHSLPIATGNRAHYERALPFGLAASTATGVLAPNATLRERVTAFGREDVAMMTDGPCAKASTAR